MRGPEAAVDPAMMHLDPLPDTARGPGTMGPRDGQGRDRTADTVIFSHVLYQLSYLAPWARQYDGPT